MATYGGCPSLTRPRLRIGIAAALERARGCQLHSARARASYALYTAREQRIRNSTHVRQDDGTQSGLRWRHTVGAHASLVRGCA
eukprot:4112630-Prymnesium_polylepis.1